MIYDIYDICDMVLMKRYLEKTSAGDHEQIHFKAQWVRVGGG